MLRKLFTFTLIAFMPLTAQAAVDVGATAPDFTAANAQGGTIKLSDYKDKIVVLEWHNPECPFVVKHYGSQNMQKLQQYAHDKGVVWLTINSGAQGKEGTLDMAKAQEYSKSHGLASAQYLIDINGSIGKTYGATATPHMFIIDAQGKLVYKGAIDDKPTADAKDIADARNYVKEALDSLLENKPVATASTQAYGCSIKYAD